MNISVNMTPTVLQPAVARRPGSSDSNALATDPGDSARLRAFEQAVREHLHHPATEWTVKRITARQWYVVDHRDARIAVRTTKKAAHAAIDDSTERRIWDENCAWYRGESTDPRTRQLTTEEKAIAAAVLIETAGSGGADGGQTDTPPAPSQSSTSPAAALRNPTSRIVGADPVTLADA